MGRGPLPRGYCVGAAKVPLRLSDNVFETQIIDRLDPLFACNSGLSSRVLLIHKSAINCVVFGGVYKLDGVLGRYVHQ